MTDQKNSPFNSQVQNRLDAEEPGEEVLRSVTGNIKDVADFQLNKAGGPLNEEYSEQDQ